MGSERVHGLYLWRNIIPLSIYPTIDGAMTVGREAGIVRKVMWGI